MRHAILRLVFIHALAAAAMLTEISCRNAGNNPTGTGELPAPPRGYAILASAGGDIDGDGRDELAVAWTPQPAVPDLPRRLAIYRKGLRSWELMHACSGPLMNSSAADPFHSLELADGEVVIGHLGREPRPWEYLHRYRPVRGKWVLTAAMVAEGDICDTFTTLSFAPPTGRITLRTEYDGCDETGTEVAGKGQAAAAELRVAPASIPMDQFHPGQNVLETKGGRYRF